MAKVGSLLIDLGINVARLQSDVGKATSNIQRMERSFGKSLRGIERRFTSVTRFLGRFTAAVGVTAGAGGLAFMAKSTIVAADQIQKLSIRIGASTEALSEYQHVAALSDVSNQTLALGWQRMTRRIAEAAQGTGEARGALEELRLEAATLNQLRPEQQFEIIADAMQGVELQSDRVRLAMKLFDSEGVALLQTMTKGSAGIREMRSEARELGLSLSKDAADAAAHANDTITRLAASIRGTLTQALTAVGPYLTEFFDRLSGKQTPVKIAGQISEANAEIVRLRFQIAQLAESPGIFDRASEAFGFETLSERASRLNQELSSIILKRSELMGMQQEMLPTFPADQLGGVDIVSRNPEMEARVEAAKQMQMQMADIEYQITQQSQMEAQRRARIVQFEQSTITDMRMGALQSAVGLLQTLGQKSKDAARAAILLNRGLSIAQAVQNTAVAYTKALTVDPTGALAARVATLGKIQIGIIAATGLAELANVNSGSGTATGGVPASSNTFAQPTTTTTAPESQRVTNIYLSGWIDTPDGRRVLVDVLRDADRDDVTFISSNGANAQAVRSGF